MARSWSGGLPRQPSCPCLDAKPAESSVDRSTRIRNAARRSTQHRAHHTIRLGLASRANSADWGTTFLSSSMSIVRSIIGRALTRSLWNVSGAIGTINETYELDADLETWNYRAVSAWRLERGISAEDPACAFGHSTPPDRKILVFGRSLDADHRCRGRGERLDHIVSRGSYSERCGADSL